VNVGVVEAAKTQENRPVEKSASMNSTAKLLQSDKSRSRSGKIGATVSLSSLVLVVSLVGNY